MERQGNCLSCGRSSYEQYCPSCSTIDYVEEEELVINWCEMCEDEIIPEGEKYCQYCIEDHKAMHDIKCNPRCIVCAEEKHSYHDCADPDTCTKCEDDGYGDFQYEREKDRRMMEDE